MNAVVFIPLTQGKVTVIDFEDFEKVRAYKWFTIRSSQKLWYAARWISFAGGKKIMYMHRFLCPGPSKKEVHHWDGDGLCNQRANLVRCSRSQNYRGKRLKRPGASSNFRGVSWGQKDRRWRASIFVNQKAVSLGQFKKEKDAARAYDAAARKHFGKFASPNFQ